MNRPANVPGVRASLHYQEPDREGTWDSKSRNYVRLRKLLNG